MDIKRTALWVVFTVSLLFLWDNWMRHTGQPSMFFPTAAQLSKANADGIPPVKSDVPQATASSMGEAAVSTPTGASTATAVQGEIITITTDLVKADIDTNGGKLVRLELLKHKESVKREWYAGYLALFGHDDNATPANDIVLFDHTATRTYLARTGLIGGPFPNHDSGFVAKPGPRSLDGGDQVQLVLESEQNGVKLIKTFTFKRDDYAIDIQHTVVNNSGAPIAPSLYLQLLRDGSKAEGDTRFYSSFTGAATYATDAEHYQKLPFDKFRTAVNGRVEPMFATDNGWIAMVQHYFVSAFVPPEHAKREVIAQKMPDTNLYAISTILPLGTIAPGATASMDARLYSGPEVASQLEKITLGLDLVKDYSWLTIVAKPIFWLMEQIHKILGNWGWTIIGLTVVIKLAFFPLSAASYRSMAKMKVVTPKMQSIRERFKSDPQKMNQAMMELYKTEKINPLGGCLPILIQMPVFIALYWVLSASVEMRNAPWLGWIHDLAAPDPLYILPLVMAVSMFIQTRLNPTPPDPVQAKVMMFMPVIFSVMFFFFPSGLVLYQIVNNALSIAQQWVITKKLGEAK